MLRFRRIVPLRARSFATGAPHESEYVTRRRVYNLQVAASRKKFAETTRRLAEEQRALEEATIFSRQGLAAARAARKREKSLAKQVMHKENLALVQRVAVERQKERQAHWKKRCVEEEKSREQVADLLAVHAANWITEDTLKMHVERAVDTFLIAGDSERER